MKLGEIGEFGFIAREARPFLAGLPRGVLGIGDDAAVIPWTRRESLLLTIDMLVEDAHFLRARIAPRDLGHKALAVNLSDIAAMGGRPRWALISLGLPADTDVEWMDDFYRGLRALARSAGVALLGGDTTRSPKGLVIDVAVLGTVARGRAKLRSGARTGDVVAVTGFLGDSAGGLRILLEGRPLDRDGARLVRAHHRPIPRLAEGAWLGARPGVRAMMDISDGVDSDIRRIMERSARGAEIELDRLPVSRPLARCALRYGWDPFELAGAGGEDYGLLVTIDAAAFPRLAAAFGRAFGRPLRAIGRILPRRAGLRYLHAGRPAALGRRGFDHFRR